MSCAVPAAQPSCAVPAVHLDALFQLLQLMLVVLSKWLNSHRSCTPRCAVPAEIAVVMAHVVHMNARTPHHYKGTIRGSFGHFFLQMSNVSFCIVQQLFVTSCPPLSSHSHLLSLPQSMAYLTMPNLDFYQDQKMCTSWNRKLPPYR